MKMRVIITTVVSFLLLVAVVAAGLNAIFTVTLIDSEFSVYSEAGKRDAETLKAELNEFIGDSTTFLDVDDVVEKVEKYPCFRVESVEKKIPKTVAIKIVERREFYAVPDENGSYAVLDEEGVFLYNGENTNRLGGTNIVLQGFGCTFSTGESAQGEYLDEAFEMFSVFSELLPGIRANVVSLRLVSAGQDTPENKFFVVTMREGVQIAIRNPSEGIAIKARAAFTDEEFGYLSPNFSDKRRVYGAISVGNLSPDGTSVNVTYFDELPI